MIDNTTRNILGIGNSLKSAIIAKRRVNYSKKGFPIKQVNLIKIKKKITCLGLMSY